MIDLKYLFVKKIVSLFLMYKNLPKTHTVFQIKILWISKGHQQKYLFNPPPSPCPPPPPHPHRRECLPDVPAWFWAQATTRHAYNNSNVIKFEKSQFVREKDLGSTSNFKMRWYETYLRQEPNSLDFSIIFPVKTTRYCRHLLIRLTQHHTPANFGGGGGVEGGLGCLDRGLWMGPFNGSI